MSRWGDMIPHREDDESCLCGCQDDIVSTLEGDPPPGEYVLSTRRGAGAGRVAALSPGSVPPEVASRFPVDFIEQVNQARRPGVVGGPA